MKVVFQWLGVVKGLFKEETKFVISLRVECKMCFPPMRGYGYKILGCNVLVYMKTMDYQSESSHAFGVAHTFTLPFLIKPCHLALWVQVASKLG
jgi:hypothetical protein